MHLNKFRRLGTYISSNICANIVYIIIRAFFSVIKARIKTQDAEFDTLRFFLREISRTGNKTRLRGNKAPQTFAHTEALRTLLGRTLTSPRSHIVVIHHSTIIVEFGNVTRVSHFCNVHSGRNTERKGSFEKSCQDFKT